MKKRMALALTVIMAMATTATASAKVEQTYTAIPTGQTVTLNGQKINFAAYNIEGNNYFKLRDLAAAMDGTEKNFNVDYNKEKDSVEITSLTAYTTGNKGVSGYTKYGNQKAYNSPQTMYLDEEKVTLKAYAVLDYNYCKLRDVANLLDFAVDWNPNTNTVNIGTDRGIDESITVEKEQPKVPVTPPASMDSATKKAINDIVREIGPGGREHWVIEGNYDEKDWNQLVTNPYSSETLTREFDSYKKYGDIENFKAGVAGWLCSGGDDADNAADIEVFG